MQIFFSLSAKFECCLTGVPSLMWDCPSLTLKISGLMACVIFHPSSWVYSASNDSSSYIILIISQLLTEGHDYIK